MASKYDIAIVGGGVVGLLTSLALAKAKLNIIHIEKDELEVKNDNRSLALSYSSIAFLNTLEIWDKITSSTQPIQKVHISDKGKYGRAEIFAKDENLPFLGTIAPMQELLRVALEAVANNPNITKSFATNVEGLENQDQSYSLAVKHKNSSHQEVIQAKLIIACDGANSSIRKMLDVAAKTTDYEQDAIVFDIQTELEHKNTAFERFMSDGVLAVLPKTDNIMGCVWTVDRSQSKSKLNLDVKEFEKLIQGRFGYRLGQLKLVSKPAVFPLYLMQSEEMYKQNVLFFGNALHFLHPVSGQGLNLSIRDIGFLYDLLNNDFSEQTLNQKLAEFAKVRKPDHDRTIYIIHGFIRWFVSDDPKLAASRNIGLHLLQRSKLAKKALSRVMMGKLSKGSTLMRKVVE
ncbi:2-octaprenyl-3-methyl-6-methoxy-1,4-benzoquinol hydroxylase [Allofrancisella inopinata]|uniref:2-octaprenyl-6-methoxyphenyl hydroxylase n=1 Tax=Allofrancisella inopinata TaxID=1085647 RepID=A0AAE6YI08_9GAMM|nr:FAD-dependent monooxygenase [Allofrancisella inopinata]QIV95921.1 2-octaprenyl-6-methoxyphenyl hydroxylase [Allofrancisella inopinata]TDT74340.1 2-octaprenyl-3-methyl-6-methoxy-1,4-benzoquinol hydroxylase [Allofrancisella inopinata]